MGESGMGGGWGSGGEENGRWVGSWGGEVGGLGLGSERECGIGIIYQPNRKWEGDHCTQCVMYSYNTHTVLLRDDHRKGRESEVGRS